MKEFTSPIRQPIIDFLTSLDQKISWEQEFAQGKIRVGKYFVGQHYILSSGDKVIYDPELSTPEPRVNFNYSILYEDEILAVINKPAPLPIHPTGTYFHHTLTSQLSREGKHWHTVNRLDSETSGVLFLAKKVEYARGVRQALLTGKKIYITMTYDIAPVRFTVEMPLGKKSKSLVLMRKGYNAQGKNSKTLFRRIHKYRGEDGKDRSLLFAQPITGRTHQIRSHLAEKNFPLVGDKIYGKDEKYFIKFLEQGWNEELEKKLEIKRQFLHCWKINTIHPLTHKAVQFQAPLPPDLSEYLRKLKKLK